MAEGDNVGFDDANDTLNASDILISNMAAVSSATVRFVLRDNGNFYISESSANIQTGALEGNLNTSYSVEALPVDWFEYDPTVFPTDNGVSDIGILVAPSTFSNIDFIGFHLEAASAADGTIGSHNGANFGVRNFTASAATTTSTVVVPQTFTPTRGLLVSGGAAELSESDNIDVAGILASTSSTTAARPSGTGRPSNTLNLIESCKFLNFSEKPAVVHSHVNRFKSCIWDCSGVSEKSARAFEGGGDLFLDKCTIQGCGTINSGTVFDIIPTNLLEPVITTSAPSSVIHWKSKAIVIRDSKLVLPSSIEKFFTFDDNPNDQPIVYLINSPAVDESGAPVSEDKVSDDSARVITVDPVNW